MASSLAATTFPLFALLPAEIQLQIWESTPATLPGRKMHIFDVQAPPPPSLAVSAASAPTTQLPLRRAPSHRRTRSRARSQSPSGTPSTTTKSRSRKSTSSSCPPSRRTASNLSTLPTVTLAPFTQPTSFDPSIHTLRSILRATSINAAATVDRHLATVIPSASHATIELPSGQRIAYDKTTDVLHLRFLAGGEPLSTIFRSLWSPALAAALHGARRIAIDVAQIWPALADEQARLVQDIVFLVCTLQNALEVLYLVDYSSESGAANALRSRDSALYSRFHESLEEADAKAECEREADVISGNGTVWKEVFDLEGLGWHERHPGFVFGEIFGEVVRLQQGRWAGEGGGKLAIFQGVRVLVAENELGGVVDGDCMDES